MEWTAKLKDELSASAGRMKKSLDGVKSAMKEVDAATDKVEMASKQLKKTQDQYATSQKRLEVATEARVGAEKTEAAALKRLKTLEEHGSKDKKKLIAAKKKLATAAKQRTAAEKAEKKAAADVAKANAAQEKAAHSLRKEYGKLTTSKKKLDAELSQSKKKFSDLGQVATKLGITALGAVAAGAGIAVLGIGKLYMELGRLSMSFGKAIFQASGLASTTRKMFAAAAGGDISAGRKAFDEIHELSLRTGDDFLELRREYGTLKSVGIEGPLLEDLLRLRAATKGMGEEAESAWGKFTDAMVEGEVTASQFEDLTKVIAQGDTGRAEFGKALGLSAEAMVENGKGAAKLGDELKKLDPRKFLEISVAFADSRMDLDAMALGAKSFDQRFRNAWNYFKREIGKDVEFDVEGAIGGFVNWMRSPDGKNTIEMIKVSFQDMGAALETAAKFGAAFFRGFNDETDEGKIEGAAEAIRALASEENLKAARDLGAAIAWIPTVIKEMTNTTGEIDAWSEEWLSSMSTTGLRMPKALREPFHNALRSIFSDLAALPGELYASATGAGMQLMSGLTDGIRSMASAPKDALAGVAASLKGILPTTFKMHSPSKVMEEQAENLMSPLEQRVANDNSAQQFGKLTEQMLFPIGSAPMPMRPAAQIPQLDRYEPLTPSEPSKQITIDVGGVTVRVDGSSGNAEDIARQLEQRLEEMMRNVIARAVA